MYMVAAALEEELEPVKRLCRDLEKIPAEKTKLWQGVLDKEDIVLLRTGIGPKRSAGRLESALELVKPSRILVTGYAGALDPALKVGCLVEAGRAFYLRLQDDLPGWEHACTDGEFELMPCESVLQIASDEGLKAIKGDVLTSAHVLGNPLHKRMLREKFGAAIVDMETAALARVASSGKVPISCIRVVSDEAGDTFLEPFGYDPSAGIPTRAKQLLRTGMAETYREWKTHSETAKESLTRFLARYLIRDSRRRIRD
jgi:adenosylhomocysteine nucleosidase